MDVSPAIWWFTIIVATVFLAVDVVIVGRRPHVPSMRECARLLVMYVSFAVLFGIWVWRMCPRVASSSRR